MSGPQSSGALLETAGKQGFQVKIVSIEHIGELETEIMVLEGMVEVVHRNDLDSPQMLMAGGTGFADFKSLQRMANLTPEICERRTSMLRTYVGWIQKQVHG